MIWRALTVGAAMLAGAATAQPYPAAPKQISGESCAAPEDWAQRAAARASGAPLGLPPVPQPDYNPPTAEKVALGRKLFFDRRLSINGTMSCAMCHVPEQGFANWEVASAIGVEGRSVKRNAPTLINVAYMAPLFHDGRDAALETQFIGPIVARNEMANPSAGLVVARLHNMPDYPALFEAAFGAPASLDRIGEALAAYQRSLTLGASGFDQWLYGGQSAAISPAAQRGFALFTGAPGCASCHPVGDSFALLTDLQFHDTGYGRMREALRQHPPESVPVQVAPGVVHHVRREIVAAVSATREADLGRYEVTEDPQDRWKFRTPSLRNVAITPPYMHDGGFSTLAEVLAFYNEGGAGLPGQDPRIRPLGLSAGDLDDLEAFLRALTSDGVACLVAEARSHPPDNY